MTATFGVPDEVTKWPDPSLMESVPALAWMVSVRLPACEDDHGSLIETPAMAVATFATELTPVGALMTVSLLPDVSNC